LRYDRKATFGLRRETSNLGESCKKQTAMSQKINIERAPNVVLYTRRGCHLCDDAVQLLLQHGVAPTLVDVDADAELKSRFDVSVPVVEIDGRIRFRGRVEPVLLRRILQSYEGSG
jgi:glutaredoxin